MAKRNESKVTEEKRPVGRPTECEKSERIQARATPLQKEIYLSLGGNEWLCRQLEKQAKKLNKGV